MSTTNSSGQIPSVADASKMYAGPPMQATYHCSSGGPKAMAPNTSVVTKRRSRPSLHLFSSEPREDPDGDEDPDGREDPDGDEEFGGNKPSLPALRDYAVTYCKLLSPAFLTPDLDLKAGQVPIADGALVTRFLRCPSDITQPNMDRFIRYPELIQVASPVMLPSAEIIARQAICTEAGCVRGGVWNNGQHEEIRWCPNCHTWMHIDCLKAASGGAAIQDFADCLPVWNQEYLFYTFKTNRPTSGPPSLSLSFCVSIEHDTDFDDAEDTLAWPDTTWGELACLPIRRRTRPRMAPQTIEVLIQYAIYMCRMKSSPARVPHPRLWLAHVSPQSGVRAVKVLVANELRRFREGTGCGRYICINCHAGVV
ncbi:hypothetical protein FB107DRAFT_278308 [Schizophyllum commune]